MKIFKRIIPAAAACVLLLGACSSVPSDPKELADYALEKTQEMDYDALAECGTERFAEQQRKAKEDAEKMESKAGGDELAKEAYEQWKQFSKELREAVFDEGEMKDMKNGDKQVRYEVKEGSSMIRNIEKLRVRLQQVDGEWKVDEIY